MKSNPDGRLKLPPRAAEGRLTGNRGCQASECFAIQDPSFGILDRGRRWARLDSNQGPTDYESAALTS